MLAPPWKPSSFSSLNHHAARKLPRKTPGIKPMSKLKGLSVTKRVRLSTSADGPVKLRAWMGCGSKLFLLMA